MNFFKGILAVTWIYACGWGLYQIAWSRGESSVVCPAPGYRFEMKPAFGQIVRKK